MKKLRAAVRAMPCAYYRVGAPLAVCASLVVVGACERSYSQTAPGSSTPTRVQGFVTDGVRRPIAGATVRVQDGPMAGTTVESSVSGGFDLASTLSGTVTLQVAREGFKSAIHTARWQPATNRVIDVTHVTLDLLEAPAQLDPGSYSLTISMDLDTARDLGALPPCAGIPAEMMSRSYDATIAGSPQSGFARILSIVGPTVFSNSHVGLSIAGQFVGFEIDFPFTEELSGFRYLNIIGNAPTDEPVTVSETGVSIPFHALFQYCELKSPARLGWENCQHVPAEQMIRFHACASNRARMVFTKR